MSTTVRSSSASSALTEISGNRGGPQTSPTPVTEHINDPTGKTDSSNGKHTGATKPLEQLLSNTTTAFPYTRTRTKLKRFDWRRIVQEERKLTANNACEGLIIRGGLLVICRNKHLIECAWKRKAREPRSWSDEDDRILDMMEHSPRDDQW